MALNHVFRAARAAGIVAVGAIALSACAQSSAGTSSTAAADGSPKLATKTHVTVLLDYFVYGAHAGIYEAMEKGYYADDNIDLEVIVPNDPVASLKYVQAGKADIGIASPLDLISADAGGSDYVSFMSLVGGNLEGIAVAGDSGITSAAQLAGKKVGTSGSVSHDAILKAQIEGAGGDASKSDFVTVGSDFMKYLVDGQVAAVAAFKPDVESAKAAGQDVEFLPMGTEGGLSFPSIITYTNASTIKSKAAVIRAFVDATKRGYEAAIKDPAGAAKATVSRNAGLDAKDMQGQIEGIGDAFVGSNESFGDLDLDKLASLSKFMSDNKFIDSPLAVSKFATATFATAK
jgi:ABC-type nitrate/sulfonate/bicarbonate transport system substrate-binding protein